MFEPGPYEYMGIRPELGEAGPYDGCACGPGLVGELRPGAIAGGFMSATPVS